MEVIPPQVKDLGVLRWALFASVYIPKACPNYWSVVTQFATMSSQSVEGRGLDPIAMRAMIENLQFPAATSFSSDRQLMEEIHTIHCVGDKPLGVWVMVSPKEEFKLCYGKLRIRSDRPSHVTVYTESLGTLVGAPYHKYSHN